MADKPYVAKPPAPAAAGAAPAAASSSSTTPSPPPPPAAATPVVVIDPGTLPAVTPEEPTFDFDITCYHRQTICFGVFVGVIFAISTVMIVVSAISDSSLSVVCPEEEARAEANEQTIASSFTPPIWGITHGSLGYVEILYAIGVFLIVKERQVGWQPWCHAATGIGGIVSFVRFALNCVGVDLMVKCSVPTDLKLPMVLSVVTSFVAQGVMATFLFLVGAAKPEPKPPAAAAPAPAPAPAPPAAPAAAKTAAGPAAK